jgi:hypothetical protein
MANVRDVADQLREGRRKGAPEPAPVVVEPVIGRDDHRPFLGESDVPVVHRLTRYAPGEEDGPGEFHRLKPGDLAEVERIFVFSHGWVPGSKTDADLLYATEGEVVTAWDARLSNAHGETLVEAYVPLLDALARRDPEAAVLWFSWVDQSGTDTGLFSARNSLHATSVNGRRLAIGLADLIGEGSPQVHLIGHSHGCIVSTHAALSLRRRPEQLTLLDCPEDWFSRSGGAAGLLNHLLPRLQPGRAAGSTFVDAYASMFGKAYHDEPGLADVVDVRLPLQRRPEDDVRSPVSYNHHYAVVWYAQTVADPEAAAGYAWSRLNGHQPTELAAGYLVTGSGRLVRLAEHRPNSDGEAYVVESLINAVTELTPRNPDVLVSMELGEDALMIEFDYDIKRGGKDTRFEAAVNRTLAFSASPRYHVPSRGRFLRLPEGGSVLLQFRLVDGGMMDSATIGRLRVVRAPDQPRNLNDLEAMQVSAALGAAAGIVLTLAAVGVWSGARAIVRSLSRD